jgi:hypothetical protein
MTDSMKLFYRYGFAEKELFKSCAECFYGLAISAHMLAYTESTVYATLMTAFQEGRPLPFFIDPMTYVFARRIDNLRIDGKIKKSFKQLMAEYGPSVIACAGNGELKSDQFLDPIGNINGSLVQEIVSHVLNFQRNKLNAFATKSSVPKYAKILKKTPPTASLSPSFLVAPYFYWGSRNDPYYKINLALSRAADSSKGDMQLYAVLCFSKELLLDPNALAQVVKDYEGFDGYLVWVSGLEEESTLHSYILGLSSLIAKLSEYKKPVYSLYGGYLMLILSKFGLSGFSTGICYGVSRDVDTPVATGGFQERYYLPVIHLKRMESNLRLSLSVSANNVGLLCDCNLCDSIKKRLAKSLPMPAKDYVDQFFNSLGSTKNGVREHFVRARYKELLTIERETAHEVVTRLKLEALQIDNADRPPPLPPPFQNPFTSGHLRDWALLLS